MEVYSGPYQWNNNPDSVVEELPSTGSTCLTYKVLREGTFYFIKRLKPELMQDAHYRELFRKEFAVGQRLSSPYLPHYISLVEEGDTMDMEMEYVAGESLVDVLQDNPAYFHKRANVQRFLVQLLTGLQHLHEQRVVHLDLNPRNVLLTKVNQSVRIVDLGYCYADTEPYVLGGTEGFMAPEQQREGAHVDARSDIYIVGCLLRYIEEQTGRSLPRDLVRIMKRCLQADPKERFQTVDEMLQLLGKHRWAYLGVAACLLLSVIIGIQIYYHKYSKPEFTTFQVENLQHHVIYYNVLSDDSLTVEVTYNDTLGNSYAGDFAIPDKVSYGGFTFDVVAVGDSAFRRCYGLTHISLPQSIRRIGACGFADCTALRSLVMGDGVEEMGPYAVCCCDSLTHIRLSSSLREIPQACFLASNLHQVTIPEGVVSLAQDAFCGCTKLRKVVLPSTLQSIGRGVFFHCDTLSSITLPAQLQNIGDYAFYVCKSLTEITNLSPVPQVHTAAIPPNFPGTVFVPRGSADAYRNTEGWDQLNIQEMSLRE